MFDELHLVLFFLELIGPINNRMTAPRKNAPQTTREVIGNATASHVINGNEKLLTTRHVVNDEQCAPYAT